MTERVTQNLIDVSLRCGWLLLVGLFFLLRPNNWVVDVTLREGGSHLTHKQMAHRISIPLLLLALVEAIEIVAIVTNNVRVTYLCAFPLSFLILFFLITLPKAEKKE